MDDSYFNNPENTFLAVQLDGYSSKDSASRLFIAYNGGPVRSEQSFPSCRMREYGGL
jgi:hypothetical protein